MSVFSLCEVKTILMHAQSLPKLRETVRELLATCEHDLSLLPAKPTASHSTEVLLRVTDFCHIVQRAVLGESPKLLVQTNRKRYREFQSEIFETRPNFVPSSSESCKRLKKGRTGPVITLQDVKVLIAS